MRSQLDEAFPAPRWCLVLVPAISFSASLSTPCCPGAPSLGGDFGDCVGHLEVSSALPPPSPWHWGLVGSGAAAGESTQAQVFLAEAHLWVRERLEWTQPRLSTSEDSEGVQGADSIPQSFIFPPKVPAIPNSQCKLVIS